jgi:hypothetical protein
VFAKQLVTQVQRIYQIVQFKMRLEAGTGRKLDGKAVCAAWNGQVRVSSGDAVSEAFVDNAVSLHAKVLSEPTLREHVLGVRQWLAKTCLRTSLLH